jgi:hypothetical protein
MAEPDWLILRFAAGYERGGQADVHGVKAQACDAGW